MDVHVCADVNSNRALQGKDSSASVVLFHQHTPWIIYCWIYVCESRQGAYIDWMTLIEKKECIERSEKDGNCWDFVSEMHFYLHNVDFFIEIFFKTKLS